MYRITVTAIVDDNGRWETAGVVQEEFTRFAVWNRVPFAEKMEVTAERIDNPQDYVGKPEEE